MNTVDEASALALLATGELIVEGRLPGASNLTVRCTVGPDQTRCVYKSVSGERPLWDFPEWTLTRREVAAFELSRVLGWDLVPPTAWRDDGPAGAGMCQLWIEDRPDDRLVDVVPMGRVPDGWLEVLEAEDGAGRPVSLIHADDPVLVRMAVFDALANNADRKGGHLLTDSDGRVWGIDHGVTFAEEEKLRTVLWGWAGESIPDDVLADVDGLHERLVAGYDPVDRWLAASERDALRRRVRRLLASGCHPLPSGRWPAIPWPVF